MIRQGWATWLGWHRRFAAVAGLWFVLTALTGGVLVFRIPQPEPMDGAAMAQAARAMPPLQMVLSRAGSLHPDLSLYRLLLPRGPGAPATALFWQGDDQVLSVRFDPGTGAVLDQSRSDDDPLSGLAALHEGGFWGRWGRRLIGSGGALVLLLMLAGIRVMSLRSGLPLRERLWPPAGLRGLRRLRSLHAVLAIWAVLPLALTVLSGLVLTFPRTGQSILQALLVTHPQTIAQPGEGPADAARALAVAEAMLPGWAADFIDIPPARAAKPYYAVRLLRRERSAVEIPALVTVDRRDGSAEAQLPGRAEIVRAWVRALHRAEIYRVPLVGLAVVPALLAGLGLAIWVRKTGLLF